MVNIQKILLLQQVLTKPFTAYIIVKNDVILFYSQSFCEIAQLNPSQSAPLLSSLNYQNIALTPIEDANSPYNVYYCRSNNRLIPYKNILVEDLIHELRTASLLMDLGTRLLIESNEKEFQGLFKILKNSSLRHKLSTLVASDFIQLLSHPPKLERTALSKVISRTWNFLSDPSRIRYHVYSGDKIEGLYFDPNPSIYGNEHFLTNFLSTTLNWLENQPVTIEMEQLNRISTKISFCIPYQDHLSSLISYRLVNHYLQYITAYFNLRVYLTQSTLNIILPTIF